MIIDFNKTHWDDISIIYKAGIDSGIATLETKLPRWEEWHNSHLSICRLAYKESDDLIGFVCLSQVSSRPAYKGVAELSIYIHPNHQNKGIGTKLIQELVKQAEENGIWTLTSGIFKINQGSINFHLRNGFRIVGTNHQQGLRHGKFFDIVRMERTSEKARRIVIENLNI